MAVIKRSNNLEETISLEGIHYNINTKKAHFCNLFMRMVSRILT
jgi:hypothetical protein